MRERYLLGSAWRESRPKEGEAPLRGRRNSIESGGGTDSAAETPGIGVVPLEMTVTNSNESIVCVAEALDGGLDVHFTQKGCYVEEDGTGARSALQHVGKRFYLSAVEASEQEPVSEKGARKSNCRVGAVGDEARDLEAEEVEEAALERMRGGIVSEDEAEGGREIPQPDRPFEGVEIPEWVREISEDEAANREWDYLNTCQCNSKHERAETTPVIKCD